jgi:multicomponent Na+:H+ antiporter subunit G
MSIAALAGSIVALIGAAFLFLGALGVLRMPDVYNRMQTGAKTTTLGSILTLTGIGIYRPGWLPQMLILVAFIVITNPISTHALARAAHFAGVAMAKETVHDKLAEEERDQEEERE